MATTSQDSGYLQLAFNRCFLRKQFATLEDALKQPAIRTALLRVASNLAKPTKQPSHLRGALND